MKNKIIKDIDRCYETTHNPDSQGTVEQVKDWSKFAPQEEVEETPINYWKYACIFILLGAVAGMILSTPLFVKLADMCVQ